MGRNTLPTRTQRDLANACKKAGDKVNRLVPGKKNKARAAKYFNQQLCKDVDQKLLKVLAEELAKQGKTHSATPPKNTPKKPIKGVPKMLDPGKGVPSLTIPVPWEIPLDGVTGNPSSRGKFELKIWADPRDLEKKSKGGMVYFTVKF